jgi:hypothetical protein
MAGWYLPYCRLLARDLTDCVWETAFELRSAYDRNPPVHWRIAVLQWQSLLFVTPLLNRFLPKITKVANPGGFEPRDRRWRAEIVQRLREKSLSLVSDRRYSLVFLHLPVPHPPGMYDRKTGKFTISDQSNYLDNLVLADQVLGELRARMEETGVWDTTSILISGDHPFRAHLFARTAEEKQLTGEQTKSYVPFMLRMPGSREHTVVKGVLPNIVSRDLVAGIARGRIRTQLEAAEWLQARAQVETSEKRAH